MNCATLADRGSPPGCVVSLRSTMTATKDQEESFNSSTGYRGPRKPSDQTLDKVLQAESMPTQAPRRLLQLPSKFHQVLSMITQCPSNDVLIVLRQPTTNGVGKFFSTVISQPQTPQPIPMPANKKAMSRMFKSSFLRMLILRKDRRCMMCALTRGSPTGA